MIDPIKKYVEENREAFDHLEPPVDVLQRIQSRLKKDAVEKNDTPEKKIIPLFSKTKWLVAASILLAITTTYILNNSGDKVKNPSKLTQQSTSEAIVESPAERNADQPQKQRNDAELVQVTPQHRNHGVLKQVENNELKDIPLKDIYARLRDSSSASIRLAAVLEIDKSSISNNALDSLAKTMNNDPNSNVRLAALGVIGQYASDTHATSLLVRSFSTQADPLVQLGLVSLLGKVENTKVEHRLFALAEDPNTFAAVKEEAYAALLNQNKL